MAILFKSTRAMELRVDEYLNAVSEGMIVFTEGVSDYLRGDIDRFEERIDAIASLESKADHLRRDIEHSLYSHSLIPEHRGDVLGLLESIDKVINIAKETLNEFLIERPAVPDDLIISFTELATMATQSAEAVVLASRAFFKNLSAVKDHLHKTYFYEKEADKIGNRLKHAIFRRSDLDLAQKMHLRFFSRHIDNIADQAEEVADRLMIYSIKRTI